MLCRGSMRALLLWRILHRGPPRSPPANAARSEQWFVIHTAAGVDLLRFVVLRRVQLGLALSPRSEGHISFNVQGGPRSPLRSPATDWRQSELGSMRWQSNSCHYVVVEVRVAVLRSAPEAALVFETERFIQADGAQVRFDNFERDSDDLA